MLITGASSSGLNIDSSNAVQILLLVAALSLIPAILFCVTGFSRILIVLGFIRTALGTQNTPPNQVLVGMALFLTLFVMMPTINAIKVEAWDPLEAHQISTSTAINRAEVPLREFMFKQTGASELSLFVSLAKIHPVPKTEREVPTYVLIPAFIMSEMTTAFEIGFLIFLPFLIIDLIVSSTLMSMGMIMLPPTFISLPFKILLFVLVDGWDLIARALVSSFH
jgi:flagellar biosynthesis protein FliP